MIKRRQYKASKSELPPVFSFWDLRPGVIFVAKGTEKARYVILSTDMGTDTKPATIRLMHEREKFTYTFLFNDLAPHIKRVL